MPSACISLYAALTMPYDLCICWFLVLTVSPGFAEYGDVPVDLKANLAQPVGRFQGRATGILHSFNATYPPNDTVKPLHLHMYRGPERFQLYDVNCSDLPCPWLFANVKRLVAMGTQVQFLLSDIYFAWRAHVGLPDSVLPGDQNNFTLWEDVVNFSVKWAIALEYDHIMWDIYNEPNVGFENRSVAQFYEVWRRAYQIIKSVKSDLTVIGPSVADLGWDDRVLPWIQQFLLVQVEYNTLPDVLCWHVGYSNGSVLVQQHKQIRLFIDAHHLGIQRIAHNEMIGPSGTLSPGVIVSFLANLERLEVDHACRACWREYDPVTGQRYDSCWDQTLDGLLTVDGQFEPRSAWWVYRWYAEMNGHTIALEGKLIENGLDGIVVQNDTTITALFGHIGDVNDGLVINLTVVNVSAWSRVKVTVLGLPFSGMEPLLSPPLILTHCGNVTNHQLVVTLPHIYSNETMFLQISSQSGSCTCREQLLHQQANHNY